MQNDSEPLVPGYWDIDGEGGSFAMHRPAEAATEVEAEACVTIDNRVERPIS